MSLVDECSVSNHPAVKPMRREDDGTIYAFRCSDCGGTWKVYQKVSHRAGCPAPPEKV